MNVSLCSYLLSHEEVRRPEKQFCLDFSFVRHGGCRDSGLDNSSLRILIVNRCKLATSVSV